MAGRICGLCSDSQAIKRAAELIAEGLSDQKIADQLNLAGNAGRMLVSRHRRFHVEVPARMVAEAASKGRANVQERERLVAAAEAGDLTAAFLGLEQITADLHRIQQRLNRAADGAELDRQRVALAGLCGQLHRNVEMRAKIAGLGGFAVPRAVASDGPKFELNIIFSGGRSEHIVGTPIGPDDPAFNAVPAAPLSIGSASGSASARGAGDEADGADFDEDV